MHSGSVDFSALVYAKVFKTPLVLLVNKSYNHRHWRGSKCRIIISFTFNTTAFRKIFSKMFYYIFFFCNVSCCLIQNKLLHKENPVCISNETYIQGCNKSKHSNHLHLIKNVRCSTRLQETSAAWKQTCSCCSRPMQTMTKNCVI